MKMTIDHSDFINQFERYNRMENFSHWALNRLYDYFIELEDSTGEEMELDVIAICCDYCEQSLDSLAADYSELTGDETNEELIEWLNEQTIVVAYDDENVIYQAF